MAESAPTQFPPIRLCASSDLAEKGLAFVFDVLQWREPMRAFVLRFDGRVVGYLNRCVHVPSEMDVMRSTSSPEVELWVLPIFQLWGIS